MNAGLCKCNLDFFTYTNLFFVFVCPWPIHPSKWQFNYGLNLKLFRSYRKHENPNNKKIIMRITKHIRHSWEQYSTIYLLLNMKFENEQKIYLLIIWFFYKTLQTCEAEKNSTLRPVFSLVVSMDFSHCLEENHIYFFNCQ